MPTMQETLAEIEIMWRRVPLVRYDREQSFNTEMMAECLDYASRKQAVLDCLPGLDYSPEYRAARTVMVTRHRDQWLARAISWASR